MSSRSLIQNELDSWKQDHNVRFDELHKKTSQELLNFLKDDERLYFACKKCSLFLNFTHKHYFIVAEPKNSAPHYIEFGSNNLDYENARVNINLNPREKKTLSEFRLTKQVRQRIEHVLGMKNFSLCFRNSEHVANYIYLGNWYSDQVESIRTYLNIPMSKREIQFLNKFPSKIRPYVFIDENIDYYKRVYSFLPQDIELFEPYKMEYFLDSEQDSYNILLIGPTGAGKSNLVNVIFNRKIVDSEAGLDGITDEIVMIKCMGRIYDNQTNTYMDRKIIITDTIGLSDRRSNEANSPNLLQFLKDRISSNFRKFDLVYIVFSNDRLLQEPIENIRNVLNWLNYERNSTRVRFIITKADYLDEDEKIDLKKEAIEKFNIKKIPRTEFKPNDEYLIYFTGFLPELENNMTPPKKDRITQELRALYDNMKHCDDSNRIDTNIYYLDKKNYKMRKTGGLTSKFEIDQIKFKEPGYNKEAREKSLAILNNTKNVSFKDDVSVDIFTSKNSKFPEESVFVIKCGIYFIGFNPAAKEPYESYVEIFHSKVNYEKPKRSEDFLSLKLNDMVRKRISILLGLSYSFLKHNSYDVCYYIFNGKFNEKHRQFIYWRGVKDSFSENENKETVKISENLYKTFEQIGVSNRTFFRFILEEFNAAFVESDSLFFDGLSRENSLKYLDAIPDGTVLQIKHKNNLTVDFPEAINLLFPVTIIFMKYNFEFVKLYKLFDDWIITSADDKYAIKFNHKLNFQSLGIRSVLEIAVSSYTGYQAQETFKMDDEKRKRIKHILGMSNHSFLMRNSEHAMTYIHRGIWFSQQSEKNGKLEKLLIDGTIFSPNITDYSLKDVYCYEIEDLRKFINRFPLVIKPHSKQTNKPKHSKQTKIYEFLTTSIFKPTEMQYYLDDSKDTYNVLLIGPTGAGKSRLINTIFNRNVVESKASLNSVTREIYFLRGEKQDNSILPNNKEIILVDTIGLCDTEWGIERTHNYIKGRLHDNLQNLDIVLVAITVDHLLTDAVENIKIILEWLRFKEFSKRFIFVITKSGNLKENKKYELKSELKERLGLIDTKENKSLLDDNDILFTDFPKSEYFTSAQEEKRIKKDFKDLIDAIVKERDCPKVPVEFENKIEEISEKRGNNNSGLCNLL